MRQGGTGTGERRRNARLRELERNNRRIRTALGGIVDGRFAFCGLDTTREIAGSMTQTEALLLWVLGRRPAAAETRLVDAMLCVNIYPDIRIWSIRAGALAAAAGAPLSSCFGVAHAAFEGRIFGVPAARSFEAFLRDVARRSARRPLPAVLDGLLARGTRVPGFGRPLIPGPDERYARIAGLLEAWRHPRGPFVRLLFDLVPLLLERKGVYPNYAALFTAILMDEPFALRGPRIWALAHFFVALPSYAAACEVAERPPGTPLLSLKVDDIEYTGRPKRSPGSGTGR